MPKISEVITNSDKPVLINFQNGKIKPGEEKSLESACFLERGSHKKLVGVSSCDMLYSGYVTEDPNYNTFLVVQTEGSKKVKLIQVDTCVVAPLLETKLDKTSIKTAETLGDLRKQFGSKKAKRFTEQQERLTMNVENVKEHLEKSVADISVTELPQVDEGESFYKPKINRNATAKEDVYQLENLVPQDVLDTLAEKVSEILEYDDLSDFKLLPTVEKGMLQMRSSSHSERVVVNRCKILLYLHYLVKFLGTPLKHMTRKFVACDCSTAVDKHIKQNYTINGTRPLAMKDKGLCYTIVLLMLALDYEIDLDPIAKDLKIGLKKMQEMARNLGFSQSSKLKTGIVLKIPVPPPLIPNLKRRRTN